MNCIRCGEHHENDGRRFCDACIPRCKCGKLARTKRTTCSNECSIAQLGYLPGALERATKPCEVCGKGMRGAPSTLVSKRWCGAECKAKRPRATTATKLCMVCAKPCEGQRKTCGDACLAQSLGARVGKARGPNIHFRSESKRATRRRAKAASYRGADKADVVARLTLQQRGRCKVCRGEGLQLGNGKRGLVLDHCHETGKPRAMLCSRCNAAYGQMRESPDLIAALWKYARTWAQRTVPHVA